MTNGSKCLAGLVEWWDRLLDKINDRLDDWRLWKTIYKPSKWYAVMVLLGRYDKAFDTVRMAQGYARTYSIEFHEAITVLTALKKYRAAYIKKIKESGNEKGSVQLQRAGQL